MSWDVMLFKFEGEPPDFEELPDDFKPPTMGDAAALRRSISASLPGVDWSDPAWGILDGDGWSIEFNHQATGQTDQIMLHVRGGGDPIVAIVKLCKTNGWSAFDTSSGEFLNLDAPSAEGWTGFQEFRDKVVATSTQEQPQSLSRGHYVAIGLGVILVMVIIVVLVMKNR